MKVTNCLITVFLFMSCSGGETTTPSPPVPSSKIAFTSEIDGNQGLYTVNADGTDLQQLTSGNDATRPLWSPDGSALIYVSQEEFPELQVVKIGRDGENAIEIGAIDNFSQPAWSPDGTRILFKSSGKLVSFSSTDASAITVAGDMDLPGAETPFYYEFDWHPDGSRIFFAASLNGENQPPGLFSVNNDGTDIQQVFFDDSIAVRYPKVSPDGSTVLFLDRTSDVDFGNDVYTIESGGSGLKLAIDGQNNLDPEWSPDGSMIAVQKVTFPPAGVLPNILSVFNATNDYRLIFTADVPFHPVSLDYSVAWSPDSRKLLSSIPVVKIPPAVALVHIDVITGEIGFISSQLSTLGFFDWSPEIK